MPLQAFLKDALPESFACGNGGGRKIDSTNHLICLSSSRKAGVSDDDSCEVSVVHAHVLPCIPGYFSGVGDLFSALVLAHFDPSQDESTAAKIAPSSQVTPLSRAASVALSKTFAILRRTHKLCTLPGDGEEERLATDEERDKQDPERRVQRMRRRELRLIESQDILRTDPAPAHPRGGQEEIEDDSDSFVRLKELQLWPNFWSRRQ